MITTKDLNWSVYAVVCMYTQIGIILGRPDTIYIYIYIYIYIIICDTIQEK